MGCQQRWPGMPWEIAMILVITKMSKRTKMMIGVNLDVVLERVRNEGLTEKGWNTGQHARS